MVDSSLEGRKGMVPILKMTQKRMSKHLLSVQILFTLTAFLIMVVLSYIFTSRIVRTNLVRNVESILAQVESQINSDLMESYTVLDYFAQSVQNLIQRGDDAAKLTVYNMEMTKHLFSRRNETFSPNGLFGYIEKSPEGPFFFNGVGWNPLDSWYPPDRPWYKAAVEAGGDVAETEPFIDTVTNETVIAYSRCLFDDGGNRLGVVAIDVRAGLIGERVVNTAFAKDNSYGVLISQDLSILGHPNPEYIGMKMYDPTIPLSVLADELIRTGKTSEVEYNNWKNEISIAFFKTLHNGWRLGLFVPKNLYYRPVYNMSLVLGVFGSLLALILIFVLVRVDAARNKSDLESRNKSAFLANMSHEIRTPMNAIIGMTDLLLREPLSERQMSFASDIDASSRSLLSLINDILDLSKIESGKLSLTPVNYDFHVFLDNIVSMFRYVAQKKGLEFKFESEGKMPDYLYGDDIRLRQIITNICGNAVKYTEKGYVKLKVTVVNNNLMFEIRDTGKGIRKEDMSKLFNAFERVETEKNRNIVGTGLGLSISKLFAEMMEGKILVDSEYEQGSVFTVMIPVILGKKAESERKKTVKKEQNLYAPDANILVVDDNELNLKVAVGLLSLFKIEAKSACSGPEAIEQVQKNDFDIVFMDHMMPEMDGVEATAEIRKLGGKYKDLPIIALTANAVQGAKEMFLSKGFSGFISKPIEMQELSEILWELLPKGKIRKKTPGADGGVNKKTRSEFLDILDKIDEINTEIGLKHISGMEDMYRELLEILYRRIVPECEIMSTSLNDEDMRIFSISIHAMKATLSTIGAIRLSETALKLEMAAKEKDIELCKKGFPAFKEKLFSLKEQLAVVFPDKEVVFSKKGKGDTAFLQETIKKALTAAAELDENAGLNAINSLLVYDYGLENNVLLEETAAAFRDFNYDAVEELLGKVSPDFR